MRPATWIGCFARGQGGAGGSKPRTHRPCILAKARTAAANQVEVRAGSWGMAIPHEPGGRDRHALGGSTVGELGPSAFGSCPEQMIGSTSRMQGKDTPEAKAEAQVYVGLDVSKAAIDVYLHPLGHVFRVPNTNQGLRQLKSRLAGLEVVLVTIEATGKFHRQAHRTLHAAGYPVAVVNPLLRVCSPKPSASSQRPIRSMRVHSPSWARASSSPLCHHLPHLSPS